MKAIDSDSYFMINFLVVGMGLDRDALYIEEFDNLSTYTSFFQTLSPLTTLSFPRAVLSGRRSGAFHKKQQLVCKVS